MSAAEVTCRSRMEGWNDRCTSVTGHSKRASLVALRALIAPKVSGCALPKVGRDALHIKRLVRLLVEYVEESKLCHCSHQRVSEQLQFKSDRIWGRRQNGLRIKLSTVQLTGSTFSPRHPQALGAGAKVLPVPS